MRAFPGNRVGAFSNNDPALLDPLWWLRSSRYRHAGALPVVARLQSEARPGAGI
jgi:hypothetical protein